MEAGSSGADGGSKSSADESKSPAAKKRKISQENSDEYQKLMRGFEMVKVLNKNAQAKTMCILGRCGDEKAVVVLEKTPFSEESARQMFSEEIDFDVILQNDIYSSAKIYLPPELNAIKSTTICPATAKHINKYTFHSQMMIHESAEDYSAITVPYIESASFNLQWVYNILEKKKEADRIVFEDPDPKTGFVLLPDLKWDGSQVENLYLVAIVHDRSLRSIRDLRQQHLGLLQNIQDKGALAIENKYNVSEEKLRIFFHYQPSYYHLHVHFTHLNYDSPGQKAGKAHLLAEVIGNIHIDGDHYEKKTLSFSINEDAELSEWFRGHRKLKQ